MLPPCDRLSERTLPLPVEAGCPRTAFACRGSATTAKGACTLGSRPGRPRATRFSGRGDSSFGYSGVSSNPHSQLPTACRIGTRSHFSRSGARCATHPKELHMASRKSGASAPARSSSKSTAASTTASGTTASGPSHPNPPHTRLGEHAAEQQTLAGGMPFNAGKAGE